MRITPALAGTTYLFSARASVTRDHPRACGDYSPLHLLQLQASGSPPRLRGLLDIVIIIKINSRITPALAGTTDKHRVNKKHCKDHPRACGDYLFFVLLIIGMEGSPPRLRGLLFIKKSGQNFTRITPALAGTTSQNQMIEIILEDHPRACGDYLPVDFSKLNHIGSPPRLRGLPTPKIVTTVFRWITPALAGTTGKYGEITYKIQDHPRACGDYPQKTLQSLLP